MPQFRYTQVRHMDPRPGRTYATSYYKQTPAEYQRTQQHVQATHDALLAAAGTDPDLQAWLTQGLRGYRKSQAGEYYTPMEIVTDLLSQFRMKKDVPSGMLGRWHKLFADTDYDIDMVPARSPRTNTYERLFENEQI